VRILLLAHSFNSLSQRLWIELAEEGHEVSLELDVNDAVTIDAVRRWSPDVVIAPFLKRAIPEAVWNTVRCLVVHPGIVGDRGPSALDWAVQEHPPRWGVTVLQANAEMDAGDVWASVEFDLREASKGSLYRNEVTEAAVVAVRTALERMQRGEEPSPRRSLAGARGTLRPPMRQTDRALNWQSDSTDLILRKLRAADGTPGVADDVRGLRVHCYDAHPEDTLRGAPGELIAQRDGAICRATRDGALWITHLKNPQDTDRPFKLPAAMVLGERLQDVPTASLAVDAPVAARTWREISYEEHGDVGVLHFPFYNGAMSTAQCERLTVAYRAASRRPTRVIVLAGGADFWSNGIHLNVIEASSQPAEESWRNINAIDDFVLALLTTESHLTVAALQGNAGAGGVFIALAADRVFARSGVVLNPHYRGMGNLYGSEYWTYLLPKRVGPDGARAITEGRLPMGTREALQRGLIDGHFGGSPPDFLARAIAEAQSLARGNFAEQIAAKRRTRAADEASRPLSAYRAEELERMKLNFFGFDSSYHVARHNFVRKVPKARTPSYLARHRVLGARAALPQA
jgi:putative two-component system protein, hydrogenase maturation factor HypX/HoxX